jgi:mandelamide amidase
MDSIATGDRAGIERATRGLKGVRFAIAPRYYLDGADPEIEKVFGETVQKLKDAGASVVEVDLGSDFGALVAHANWPLFFHETRPEVSAFLRDNKVPVTFEQIYEDLEPHIKDSWTRAVLATGSGYTPEAAYQDVLQTRRPEVQRRYAQLVFAQADALIFPTTLCSAPTIEEQWQYPVARKLVSDVFLSRNTYPASCAGLPGISIPMGLLENGLPVGLEMDASSGSDRALLQLARRVEEVVGFVSAPSALV